MDTNELIARAERRSSRLERAAGPALFLVVTACWMFGLLSAELNWISYSDFFTVIATVLSVVSVVVTGYFGRLKDALWLGWIPGAAMIAIGFSLSPEPGGDETGGLLIFLGGLVLFGWAVYFFPLIALGVWLRTRVEKPPPDPPAGWIHRDSPTRAEAVQRGLERSSAPARNIACSGEHRFRQPQSHPHRA